MAEHNRLGKWGEEEVIAHLVKNGYAIVEHNWRMNHLEIDIIASKGRDIVFVEVKTRREKGSRPEDAINARKISNMVRAANVYLRAHRVDLNARFDVAAISGAPPTTSNFSTWRTPSAPPSAPTADSMTAESGRRMPLWQYVTSTPL